MKAKKSAIQKCIGPCGRMVFAGPRWYLKVRVKGAVKGTKNKTKIGPFCIHCAPVGAYTMEGHR